MKQKTDALLRMSRPRTRREVRGFVGGINFYNSMFPRRAHVLQPLTRLMSDNVPFKWGATEEKAFNKIKAVLASDCSNAHPDLNEPFAIASDASDYQLGSCVMQRG